MGTPLGDDHFYKTCSMSEVELDVAGKIVQATLKLITVVRFDHLGCTIEVQYSDMDIVHWFVHVVSYSKNIVPFRFLLTYLAMQ
jgi:hypothetical protein